MDGRVLAAPLPAVVRLRAGGGQPMPAALQRKMEAAFGADFSGVRIHTGPEAASIGALAFTHGFDIYFAPGQYSPSTHFGQRLLAHELTHVVQQRCGRVRNPLGPTLAVVHDLGLEAEAERMAVRVAAASAAPVPPAVRALQRKPAPQAAASSTCAPRLPARRAAVLQPVMLESLHQKGKYYLSPNSDVLYQKVAENIYERNGQYFCYNADADLLKPCPPPPPPNDPKPPVVLSSTPLTLSRDTWQELDKLMVQSSSIGKLPSLDTAFDGAKVISYKGGVTGVYFIQNASGSVLVVKPLWEPASETFANELCKSLGLPHPDTELVDASSGAGVKILSALKISSEYRKARIERYSQKGEPKYFLVMTPIEGITLEETEDSNEGLRTLFGEPGLLEQIVSHLGLLAAFDILLYYMDRMPVFMDGFISCNVMLYAEKGQIQGVAAIDQSVHVKRPEVSKSSSFKLFELQEEKKKKGPLDEIRDVVEQIAKGDLTIARQIWTTMPQGMQSVLLKYLFKGDSSQAVKAFQKSLVHGLELVSFRLSKETIRSIKVKLSSLPDKVDTKGLKLALATIQNYFPP